ncbi:uncharacterized protein LOC134668989 [Cydia fagiglandana]|uniref:uncharacterized protein LOC134668989 n=1 Tax=Cydia fagiglandana TaxID=1458189 RepID=UPI002FEE4459
MHAYLALASALIVALVAMVPRDRLGYEREIDATRYNQVPKLLDYVLNDEYLAAQKNRAKLVTKNRPEEAVIADDVLLESNVVKIVRPAKRDLGNEVSEELVRRRRGYNLENVQVPARYPYLPVARFYRVRRWG